MVELTLQQILKEDIGDKSLRTYAAELEVAHGTLAEVMNGKQQPTLAFLMKVAAKTKRDLISLVAVAYPDAAKDLSPTSIFFAREFDKLGDETKKAILAIIESARR